MIALKIGTWHEQESRDVTQCPSYYAADTETLRTTPGEYPLRVTFEGGYLHPMPYWLLVGIDAARIAGRTFSGFGGHNFASQELPLGPRNLGVQMYAYQLAGLVAAGRVTLDAGFAWLANETPWQQPDAPKSWPEVMALAARQATEADRLEEAL